MLHFPLRLIKVFNDFHYGPSYSLQCITLPRISVNVLETDLSHLAWKKPKPTGSSWKLSRNLAVLNDLLARDLQAKHNIRTANQRVTSQNTDHTVILMHAGATAWKANNLPAVTQYFDGWRVTSGITWSLASNSRVIQIIAFLYTKHLVQY